MARLAAPAAVAMRRWRQDIGVGGGPSRLIARFSSRGAHNGRLSRPGPSLAMVTAWNKRTKQPIAMPIATLR